VIWRNETLQIWPIWSVTRGTITPAAWCVSTAGSYAPPVECSFSVQLDSLRWWYIVSWKLGHNLPIDTSSYRSKPNFPSKGQLCSNSHFIFLSKWDTGLAGQLFCCEIRAAFIRSFIFACNTKSYFFINYNISLNLKSELASLSLSLSLSLYIYIYIHIYIWGTAVAQWLRCCATNRKVAGLNPAGVSGFFIDIKSFRSYYGPGVDSVFNEYQEYFLGVKAAGA